MEGYNWDLLVNDMFLALPILLLCATALIVLVVDWFLRPDRSYHAGILALIGLLGAAYLTTHFLILPLLSPFGERLYSPPVKVFGDRLILDPLGLFFIWFFTLAALATVAVSLRAKALDGRRVGEYYALLLVATAAMAVVVCSRDFIVLFLAIETVSIPSYVLVGYFRRQRLSTEASLKYILYGGAASGMMLFGISYLYGLYGTTIIPEIYQMPRAWDAAFGLSKDPSVATLSQAAALGLGLILLLAGLGFKMAIVPFHSWCPDVYEGAPTPITAYLSVASKAAGFAAVMRILYPLFCANETGLLTSGVIRQLRPEWIFWTLSAATMTLGNLVAVWQTNVKRLLAYSSIAHAGYLLMAFTLLNGEAFEAILVYLVVYLVMNLGAFFTVIFLENATGRCDLESYRGMVRRAPLLASVLTIFLLSLLGIPPTAGFMVKFKMFGALIQAETGPAVWLAIIGVINTVISAYYYLKVVKVMILDHGEDESPIASGAVNAAIVVALAVAVFALFVFWTPVQQLAQTIPLDARIF